MKGRSDGVLRPANRIKVNSDADHHIRNLTRLEENQERAFIAASRRQDRDFQQRLESLQKASELHFARTGKRFEVTQAQVEHNGPLMELGDDERRRREARRYAPYMLDQRAVIKGHGRGDFTMIPLVSQQLSQNESGYWGPLGELGNNEGSISDFHKQCTAADRPETIKLQGSSEEIIEEGVGESLEDYSTSFFEMEHWQDYHQLAHHDIQNLLDVHFPAYRARTPNEISDLHHLEKQTTESQSIWKVDVHYELEGDISEDKGRDDE